jgi:hypothetical protein
MNALYIVSFALLSIISPENHCPIKIDEEAKIIKYLSSISYYQYDVTYVIAIPLDGCSGCRDIAIEFLKECKKSESLRYILSSSSKKKIMRIVAEEGLEKERLLIDDNNMLFKLSISTNNPVIFEFKESSICSFRILDPSIIDRELDIVCK